MFFRVIQKQLSGDPFVKSKKTSTKDCKIIFPPEAKTQQLLATALPAQVSQLEDDDLFTLSDDEDNDAWEKNWRTLDSRKNQRPPSNNPFIFSAPSISIPKEREVKENLSEAKISLTEQAEFIATLKTPLINPLQHLQCAVNILYQYQKHLSGTQVRIHPNIWPLDNQYLKITNTPPVVIKKENENKEWLLKLLIYLFTEAAKNNKEKFAHNAKVCLDWAKKILTGHIVYVTTDMHARLFDKPTENKDIFEEAIALMVQDRFFYKGRRLYCLYPSNLDESESKLFQLNFIRREIQRIQKTFFKGVEKLKQELDVALNNLAHSYESGQYSIFKNADILQEHAIQVFQKLAKALLVNGESLSMWKGSNLPMRHTRKP